MYGRFETGLKLLSSSQSADGFLRIGVTMADLSEGGTYEAWRDELIITVILGASSSLHSFMRKVGSHQESRT